MKVSESKEVILKKIREALSNPVPLPFPKNEGKKQLFGTPPAELDILFAEEFTKLLGKFAFCVNEQDAKQQLQLLIKEKGWQHFFCDPSLEKFLEGAELTSVENSDASVTSCHFLVARTGAIVLSSALHQGRTGSVYSPVHICIAYAHQLVFDTKDAIDGLKEIYGTNLPSSVSFAAGPSRTADIEKTLVVGIHGPREVYVFLIDQ